MERDGRARRDQHAKCCFNNPANTFACSHCEQTFVNSFDDCRIKRSGKDQLADHLLQCTRRLAEENPKCPPCSRTFVKQHDPSGFFVMCDGRQQLEEHMRSCPRAHNRAVSEDRVASNVSDVPPPRGQTFPQTLRTPSNGASHASAQNDAQASRPASAELACAYCQEFFLQGGSIEAHLSLCPRRVELEKLAVEMLSRSRRRDDAHMEPKRHGVQGCSPEAHLRLCSRRAELEKVTLLAQQGRVTFKALKADFDKLSH